MKKNIFNKLFLGGVLLFAGVLTSCDDYLTLLPTDSIPEENFWQTRSDVDNVRAAAYYKMTTADITNRILYWGEFRSDNVELKTQSNTALKYLMEGVLQPTQGMFDYSSFYTGISYCNKVIEKGQQMIDRDVDPTFTASEWRPIRAEMTALRALYYFYLVRAYRDVPFVIQTISTDAEALTARKGQPAEQGIVILDTLINQLEDCKMYAAKNYGNTLDNKGRFTKRSIRVLLADMYLWNACLYKNGIAKGYKVCNESGDTITSQSVMNERAKAYLQRTIDLCDEVMAEIQADYQKQLSEKNNVTEFEGSKIYPLYTVSDQNAQMTGSLNDEPYNKVFGNGNSNESIFDLQYDGTNTSNSALTGFYFSTSASDKSTAGVTVTGKSALFQSVGTVDPDKGFGKTDLRLLSSAYFKSLTQSEWPIIKMYATQVSCQNSEDMAEGYMGEPSFRSTNNANWPIYRLTDLMLIKAEAIARLSDMGGTADLVDGFKLVNEIFKRCNPGCGPSEGALEAKSERIINTEADYTTYAEDKSASDLLTLVYQERQREFFAEGKRWFDLVRQCEYANETNNVLSSWAGMTKSLQTRLRKLVSMYVPYYNDELKANPALKQNEVWDKYTPASSKPTDN